MVSHGSSPHLIPFYIKGFITRLVGEDREVHMSVRWPGPEDCMGLLSDTLQTASEPFLFLEEDNMDSRSQHLTREGLTLPRHAACILLCSVAYDFPYYSLPSLVSIKPGT